MKSIILRVRQFISKKLESLPSLKEEIMLVIGVFLISLISFAIGFISGKEEVKQPINIDYERSQNQ